MKKVHRRVRKAIQAIEQAQSKSLKALSKDNRRKNASKVTYPIKKQENSCQNAADGAQSTETTPKTPKFSDKSRKDHRSSKAEIADQSKNENLLQESTNTTTVAAQAGKKL